MKLWAVLPISLLLAACASGRSPIVPTIFNDTAFRPPSERVSADDVFALSPDEAATPRPRSPTRFVPKDSSAVLDALYNRDLRIEYDSVMTRTAAEAFAAIPAIACRWSSDGRICQKSSPFPSGTRACSWTRPGAARTTFTSSSAT
jgi:hypothetical protein